MTGYSILSLSDILKVMGEDFCRDILSSFKCPLNLDVEEFFTKRSAIDFEKQSVSRTFLVYSSYKKEQVLCGYFTIASKYIVISKSCLSNRLAKRLRKFAAPGSGNGNLIIIAPLIAQLGKNYNNNYNELISGDELLKLSIDKVREAQAIIGGKVVYLECEDKPSLVEFYTSNGFVVFGKRELDKDEKKQMTGTHLLQLLKYLDG